MNYFYKLLNQLVLVGDFIKFSFSADTVDTLDSPLLFGFYQNVIINKRKKNVELEIIEKIRNLFLADQSYISISAYGAGSKLSRKKQTRVSQVARHATSSRHKCSLLYRIAEHFQSNTILELGTNLGIATRYLAAASHSQSIITVEGHTPILEKAKSYTLSPKVRAINTDFQTYLEECTLLKHQFDMIIIDGDHNYAATIENYNYCKKLLSESDSRILIIDDIYWSRDMKRAWKDIKVMNDASVYIDLFLFGVILFDKRIKVHIDKRILPFPIRWRTGLFR